SDDESVRVSTFAAQLASFDIDDDARLKGIYESLTIDCRLTGENISQLTGLDVEDVEGAVCDPRTVPIEKKYALAIKGSYLVNAVNRARGQ
ncbi:MAG TPA: HTH domain-containing protein, partial [Humibacter sp.]|nr:HTH domain-containing protein [Humibacter sp.]